MSMEKYHFTRAGKKYSIVRFSNVPMGVLRKTQGIEDKFERTMVLLELTIGEGTKELEAIFSMSVDEFNEFFEGWSGGENLARS